MKMLDKEDFRIHLVADNTQNLRSSLTEKKERNRYDARPQSTELSSLDEKKVEQHLFEERLNGYGIYKRYQKVTLETIEKSGIIEKCDEKFKRNYQLIKDYADNLSENLENGFGLVMLGNVGTMKTSFAVAILRKYVDMGGNGLLIPMCSLLDNLFTMRERSKEEWFRFERKIRNTPLLVLDDLGTENTDQKWIVAKVDSIITERYNRQKATIITSNFMPDQLNNTYSGRILDRLRNTSRFLLFNGKSLRETHE